MISFSLRNLVQKDDANACEFNDRDKTESL